MSDWAEDDIHQYKYLKDKSEEEIVLVALDHPNDFDVYLFRHGIYWDRTYIICKHNLSPIQIYKCLGIEESMSFNRFLYDTFRVDSEGDASKTALAKEINMPRYMIFDDIKVSYYFFLVPGIRLRICLIGMQYSSLASNERDVRRIVSAHLTIAGYAERSMWFA